MPAFRPLVSPLFISVCVPVDQCQFAPNTVGKATVPKSKVRKKPEYVAPSRSGGGASAIKAAAPSPQWYPFVFVAIMLFGLAWIAVYYIAGDRIPFMVSMGSWNFLVGFAALVIGLLLAARWR